MLPFTVGDTQPNIHGGRNGSWGALQEAGGEGGEEACFPRDLHPRPHPSSNRREADLGEDGENCGWALRALKVAISSFLKKLALCSWGALCCLSCAFKGCRAVAWNLVLWVCLMCCSTLLWNVFERVWDVDVRDRGVIEETKVAGSSWLFPETTTCLHVTSPRHPS